MAAVLTVGKMCRKPAFWFQNTSSHCPILPWGAPCLLYPHPAMRLFPLQWASRGGSGRAGWHQLGPHSFSTGAPLLATTCSLKARSFATLCSDSASCPHVPKVMDMPTQFPSLPEILPLTSYSEPDTRALIWPGPARPSMPY